MDLEKLATVMFRKVREFVQPALDELSAKIAAIPAAKDGINGEPGRDGANGKDGADGASGERGTDGQPGKDGLPGEHGKDGAAGLNGSNGKDGTDGKSVTVEEAREFLEGFHAKWALEFERRALDTLQRAVDRMPAAKDGKDGKDGRDAFDLKDFDIISDGRTVKFVLARGDERIERSFVTETPQYCGVHVAARDYQKGDMVTFGGSMFLAMRSTASKPEIDDSWRLVVKRGRDGKDAR